jgi:hypothetical protein
MTTVFLVVHFQHFYNAVVAYQLSITHIHSSHHRIIADDYSRLDVLVSNPSLDQFFVMSDTHKIDIFLFFPLYNHHFVLVYWQIFSFLNFAFCVSTGTPYFDAMYPLCQSVGCIAYYTYQGLKTNCPRSYGIPD